MAKVGYIYKANRYDSFEADKEWMLEFGCVQVIEEDTGHEVMCPQWKQLMYSLDRGDVLAMVGSLPEEIAALRRSSLHVMQFQQKFHFPNTRQVQCRA